MKEWERLFTNRSVLPEQRKNVKVIYVMAKLVPDRADSFVPRKKTLTLQVCSTIAKSRGKEIGNSCSIITVFSQ